MLATIIVGHCTVLVVSYAYAVAFAATKKQLCMGRCALFYYCFFGSEGQKRLAVDWMDGVDGENESTQLCLGGAFSCETKRCAI